MILRRYIIAISFAIATSQGLISCKEATPAASEVEETGDAEDTELETPVEPDIQFDPTTSSFLDTSSPADPVQNYNNIQLTTALNLPQMAACLNANQGHRPGGDSCIADLQLSSVQCDLAGVDEYLQFNYFYGDFQSLTEDFLSEDLADEERYAFYGCYENADNTEFVTILVQTTLAIELGGQVSYQTQEVRVTK